MPHFTKIVIIYYNNVEFRTIAWSLIQDLTTTPKQIIHLANRVNINNITFILDNKNNLQ